MQFRFRGYKDEINRELRNLLGSPAGLQEVEIIVKIERAPKAGQTPDKTKTEGHES